MERNRKKLIPAIVTALICIFFSSVSCFGGAWTMPAGKLYEKISFNYYFADREFHMDLGDTDLKSFRDMNISNYIEYGLTNRFTLLNALYYKFLEKKDSINELDSNGIGDADLGIKGKIADGSWGVLSSQGLVKIPGDYDQNDRLPLGNDQFDFELRMLYGRSLWPYIPGYCNFEVGYRWRLDEPSDELRYLVEFGMDFTRDLYGRIKLDGILSMKNGEQFSSSGNPTATNSYDLGKLDMALGYKITKAWGMEIGYTPEIYGRNTTEGATYTFAITYQLK